MQTAKEIKLALSMRALSPKHVLGQNFLIDQNLIRKIVDAAHLHDNDLVLEIGPGTGALTDELIDRGHTVIACEIDADLIAILQDRFHKHIATGRLTLIHADCLAHKSLLNPQITDAIAGRLFSLVANLPYAAASPLIVTLAADHPNCRGQFVTIQREVAQRLRAHPRTRDYSELTIIVQALCTIERIATLPPECFWPQPKVTSEMIAIRRHTDPLTNDPRALAVLCRKLFTQRRKQIGTILGRDTILPQGIDHAARPEQLSIEQLVELARTVTLSDE